MNTETLSFAGAIVWPSCRAAVAILGVFLLRYFLGSRISPAWRHAFWVLVPLALLPMISVRSSLSVYNLFPQSEPAIEYGLDTGKEIVPDASRPPEYAGNGLAAARETAIPERLPKKDDIFQKNRQTIPVMIWLLGSGAMVLLFFRQIVLCRRWIADSRPVKNERILTIFESCRRQMQIKTWLVVAESPAVAGPFLVGAIRPTLLMPGGMIGSATEQQLRTVFLHELAHLKRWDV